MEVMLCEKDSITPDEAAQLMSAGGWLLQRKFDGLRAYIENGKLYDRQGKEITQRFPEFEGLSKIPVAMDGEIVAQSGEFNDISGRVHLRDQFAIRLLAKKNPAQFVAFDLPMLATMTNEERLSKLPAVIGAMKYSWLIAAEVLPDDVATAWTVVEQQGWEGLVMKRKVSRYAGGRSKDWRKVKYFCEVDAVFTKCEDHPKGVRLETADGRSVNVNGTQATDVRRSFEKNGSVRCEVRYMPIKGSEAWRFPSFRRICEV